MTALFDTLQVGTLTLKNRFFRSATWECRAEEDGRLNDDMLTLYENLARGGVGAIVTGYAFVLPEEQPNPRMFGAYADDVVASFAPMVEKVHAEDCRIFMQLVYGGTFTWHDVGERVIWGPSAVLNKISGLTAVEMTEADIGKLVAAFGDAARRAKEAGFDGVQLHAGHGYMLNQFLSPHFNRREDRYGGSSENRSRILFEILADVRNKTAEDYPVLIKLNCSDFMGEKGFTFMECKALCRKLAEAGISAIEVSGGPVFRAPKPEKETSFPVSEVARESYFSEYAKEIAAAVDVPVILVGGNRSTSTMNRLLEETAISGFSMARPLLSQPDLVNVWKADPDATPRCVSCGQCFTPEGNSCILDRKES